MAFLGRTVSRTWKLSPRTSMVCLHTVSKTSFPYTSNEFVTHLRRFCSIPHNDNICDSKKPGRTIEVESQGTTLDIFNNRFPDAVESLIVEVESQDTTRGTFNNKFPDAVDSQNTKQNEMQISFDSRQRRSGSVSRWRNVILDDFNSIDAARKLTQLQKEGYQEVGSVADAVVYVLLKKHAWQDALDLSSILVEKQFPISSYTRLRILRALNECARTSKEPKKVDISFMRFANLLEENSYSMSEGEWFQILRLASIFGRSELAQMRFDLLQSSKEFEDRDGSVYGLLLTAYVNKARMTGKYEDWSSVVTCFTASIDAGKMQRPVHTREFIQYAVECGTTDEAEAILHTLPDRDRDVHLTYIGADLAKIRSRKHWLRHRQTNG